jgi:hypothetical protein
MKVQKLALAILVAAVTVGAAAGPAAADGGHWRYEGHGRHRVWEHPRPRAVAVAAPPPVVYAPPPAVVVPAPATVVAVPAGINLVLPIHLH